MSRNVHVVPNDGGWKVRVEGSTRSKSYPTQSEAIRAGRKLARRNQADHIVHRRDGRIRQRDSYGRDPFPPRG
jgi:Arc/MetJ-type ribon-helix-helix transcriptional regulator